MGVVYEAFDRQCNKSVALKTLRFFDGASLFRFKREYRSIHGLKHPNLVRLGDLIEEDGAWYFTMDLVRGVDFLRHVRGAEADVELGDTASLVSDMSPVLPQRQGYAVDEGRLRDGLRQLADGLTFLHRAGKLHRDLKPSNVLVSEMGHVVILDLGLVVELVNDQRVSTEANVVGTVAYMSPEQAAAKRLGPESDWYSVGVMMYQALTGRLPYAGSALEVLAKKQQLQLAPPSWRQPGIPADLDQLCHELLRIDPASRPSGVDIVHRLGGEPQRTPAIVASSTAPEPLFVGREDEIHALSQALADCQSGRPVCTIVHGESGIGKTALVRRFVDQQHDALVLAGRCYERESVPYKAIDGVIDSISRHMLRLPREEVAALLPRRTDLLSQAFPVLLRVDSIANAPRAIQSTDGHDLRRRLFSAVGEMFARLADRRRTIVWIDDLHWADHDSLAMLAELLHQPDAPPILWLATSRNAVAASALGEPRLLNLRGLPQREAGVLARHLIERTHAAARLDPELVARDAEGHPLFVYELVQHGAVRAELPGGQRGLDQVLRERMERLSTPARHVLECIAIARGPLAQSTVSRAVAAAPEVFSDALDVLRAASLIRTGGSAPGDSIEPYHDRIREAVANHISTDTRRSRHEELAVALSSLPDAAPEMVATHWIGAERRDRAAEYVKIAAHNAALGLAFDRAVDLYQVALELLPAHAVGESELRRALGDVLAQAGRGAEADRAYHAAAAMAPAGERLTLQRQAAAGLLKSGHVDEGLAFAREILGAVGMKLPRTRRQLLTASVVERTRLRLRGLKFRERSAETVSREQLLRIDVAWSVVRGMGYLDPARLSSVQARNLADALDAGEPFRIARSLAVEAVFVGIDGVAARARSEKLLDLAQPIANRIGDAFLSGQVAMSRANLKFFCGSWRQACEGFDQVAAYFRDFGRGMSLEIGLCKCAAMLCLFYLGDLPEMAGRDSALRKEAPGHGDIYVLATLGALITPMVYLAADRPKAARAEAMDAMKVWSPQSFLIPHVSELLALAQVDLYEGRALDAWNRITERWDVIEDSLVFRLQIVKIMATHMRGRAALAVLGQCDAAGYDRGRAHHAVRVASATLRRTRAPWAQGLAGLLLAGLARRKGQLDRALSLLDRAIEQLDATEMALYAASARRNRGRWIGGDEGAILVAAQDEWMRRRGIVNPASISAMLVPD